MSQRLDTTKYLCYLLVLYTGPSWYPVQVVTARNPPKNPSTIETQAKFFQYRNLPTHEDFDQGHRLGSERHFTERHEKARPSEGLYSAKVRWGDKKGGYGEHYWDLNHAGHGNDHNDDGNYDEHSDDGSYHHDDDNSNHGYDGSNDHSSPYTDDYDPEKASYEENGRAKRAHPRIKPERRPHKEPRQSEESSPVKPKSRKHKEQLQEAPSQNVENYTADDDGHENEDSGDIVYGKPKQTRYRHSQDETENNQKPKEAKNQVVLVVKEKERKRQEQNPYQSNQDYSQYVPYEGGAGVRQHHQPEVTPAASVPRLFLEPTTGHVVDRATGQAYVLQPIAPANNYN